MTSVTTNFCLSQLPAACSLLVWCLTRPSLWGFQFVSVSSFFCVADHWLTSPQLLDHSDQRGPFRLWSCHECPVLALTHPPSVSRLRATSKCATIPCATICHASGLAVGAFSAPTSRLDAGGALGGSALEGAGLTTGAGRLQSR